MSLVPILLVLVQVCLLQTVFSRPESGSSRRLKTKCSKVGTTDPDCNVYQLGCIEEDIDYSAIKLNIWGKLDEDEFKLDDVAPTAVNLESKPACEYVDNGLDVFKCANLQCRSKNPETGLGTIKSDSSILNPVITEPSYECQDGFIGVDAWNQGYKQASNKYQEDLMSFINWNQGNIAGNTKFYPNYRYITDVLSNQKADSIGFNPISNNYWWNCDTNELSTLNSGKVAFNNVNSGSDVKYGRRRDGHDVYIFDNTPIDVEYYGGCDAFDTLNLGIPSPKTLATVPSSRTIASGLNVCGGSAFNGVYDTRLGALNPFQSNLKPAVNTINANNVASQFFNTGCNSGYSNIDTSLGSWNLNNVYNTAGGCNSGSWNTGLNLGSPCYENLSGKISQYGSMNGYKNAGGTDSSYGNIGLNLNNVKSGFANSYTGYSGLGTGNVGVAGDIGVSGNSIVVGRVPVPGVVDFTGLVPVSGAVFLKGHFECRL